MLEKSQIFILQRFLSVGKSQKSKEHYQTLGAEHEIKEKSEIEIELDRKLKREPTRNFESCSLVTPLGLKLGCRQGVDAIAASLFRSSSSFSMAGSHVFAFL